MMKWWGWGDPKFVFPMEEKADLWPWIQKTLDLREDAPAKPVDRRLIRLRLPSFNDGFMRAIAKFLRPEQVSADEDQRLLHSYGKSYPDLFNVRRGLVRRAPDLILFPEGHAEVEELVRLAHAHGVAMIPFGGGTNISGCVNPVETGRMIVSLDMSRMNRLLSLDPYSNTAVIEAGALGPKLEKDLSARGYSLGHCPDSFEYSSLGGWIATRSAGMQSDSYGKIEDMVVSLKFVTPSGTLQTRTVPASSAGPDLNRLVLGSEGTLGVITEATMRVHPAPAFKDYRGILFPSFELGTSAIHDCIAADRLPSMVRLQDEFETELAFHMKTPPRGLKGFIQRQFKKVLKARGYSRPAIMVVGFEGDRKLVERTRRDVLAIFRRRRGFNLGTDVGRTWAQDKFNLPYLRDAVMDRSVMVDVAETATTWSNLLNLHRRVTEGIRERFVAEGTPGFIGCHISHTYPTGCCLYFTYACRQLPGRELEQYYGYKKMITELLMKNGATLTHHHAVGTEHRPWLGEEVSETGLQALRALKASLDPKGILNPGKLIPAADRWSGWGPGAAAPQEESTAATV